MKRSIAKSWHTTSRKLTRVNTRHRVNTCPINGQGKPVQNRPDRLNISWTSGYRELGALNYRDKGKTHSKQLAGKMLAVKQTNAQKKKKTENRSKLP